jgi:predicted PurR-regulated permease PerM
MPCPLPAVGSFEAQRGIENAIEKGSASGGISFDGERTAIMAKLMQAENGHGTMSERRKKDEAGASMSLPEFARRVAVALLIALGLLALAGVAWRGVHVLLEAFAGVLFGVFLSALAEALHKRTRLSYGWSLAVVILTLCVVTAGGAWTLASRMAIQIRGLIGDLPQSVEKMQAYLSQYSWGQFLLQLPHSEQASGWAGQFLHGGRIFSSVGGFLEAVIVILVVGIFGAAEPDVYKRGLFHLVPRRLRPRVGEAVDAVTLNLRGWLVGQVLLMIVMGVTTAVALTLMGIPFALALGLIVGILEVIPYIGAWLSAIPTALIALTVGPGHMALVLGLYLFLHILEGYVLLPLIQRRAVHLPPALTILAQALLGELLGLMGLFVAAPLTVAGVVLVQMFYVEDTLGDQNMHVHGEKSHEDKSTAQQK